MERSNEIRNIISTLNIEFSETSNGDSLIIYKGTPIWYINNDSIGEYVSFNMLNICNINDINKDHITEAANTVNICSPGVKAFVLNGSICLGTDYYVGKDKIKSNDILYLFDKLIITKRFFFRTANCTSLHKIILG